MKIRVIGGCSVRSLLSESVNGRISDREFRILAWLREQTGMADLSAYAAAQGASLSDVLLGIDSLSEAGAIGAEPAGEGLEVRFPSFGGHQAILDSAERKAKLAADKARIKRANRPEIKKAPPKVSAKTLKDVWEREFRDQWPAASVPRWGMKELGLAKRFIGFLGEVDSVRAVQLVLRNWESVSQRYRMPGFPTMDRVMFLRQTAVVELLSGVQSGMRVKPSGAEAARKASEYDSNAAGPVTGWDED